MHTSLWWNLLQIVMMMLKADPIKVQMVRWFHDKVLWEKFAFLISFNSKRPEWKQIWDHSDKASQDLALAFRWLPLRFTTSFLVVRKYSIGRFRDASCLLWFLGDGIQATQPNILDIFAFYSLTLSLHNHLISNVFKIRFWTFSKDVP